MQISVLAVVLGVLVTPVWAGGADRDQGDGKGTMVQGNMVPSPLPQPRCPPEGSCDSCTNTCVGTGAPCTMNSDCPRFCPGVSPKPCATDNDCSAGSLSATKSKVTLDSRGMLKVVVGGVTDRFGVPVTTDGIPGTPDDYIVNLVTLFSPNQINLILKMDIKNGTGQLALDGVLSFRERECSESICEECTNTCLDTGAPCTMHSDCGGPKCDGTGAPCTTNGDCSTIETPPSGAVFFLPLVALMLPPAMPALCPGGNEPRDILARFGNDDACTGTLLGVFPGVQQGS